MLMDGLDRLRVYGYDTDKVCFFVIKFASVVGLDLLLVPSFLTSPSLILNDTHRPYLMKLFEKKENENFTLTEIYSGKKHGYTAQVSKSKGENQYSSVDMQFSNIQN